jgi:tellurite resistance protein
MLLKLADELDGTLSAMLAAEIETPAHLEDIVSDLVELNAPRFVLTLALRIAYADGDYSTSERSLIHSLAQHLGAASIVSAVEQDVHGEFASATIGSR